MRAQFSRFELRIRILKFEITPRDVPRALGEQWRGAAVGPWRAVVEPIHVRLYMSPHPHPPCACSFGFGLEAARRGAGAPPLSRTSGLEGSILCSPGDSAGHLAFLVLPSGGVDDPELAPLLHPTRDGSGGKALRLRGTVTAME